MNNKLYVGNLPYNVTSDGLRDLFAEFGEITEANIIIFKDSGRSRGFGFVEFVNESDATNAVSQMDQKEVGGRKLVVNIAKPMEPRDNNGGNRGGYSNNNSNNNNDTSDFDNNDMGGSDVE